MATNQPNHPGIVINETLSPLAGNPGVPGVAVAAFAANYNTGPTVPTFITSWNDFLVNYGTFSSTKITYLHYAVYQYFNNGGTGCYILSIPNTDAVTATATLKDINTPTPDNALTVSALSPGVWGNSLFVAVTSAGNTGRVNLQVYKGGTATTNLVENYIDVSMNPADPRNLITIVNSPISGSSYITVTGLLSTYTAGISDLALVTTPQALASGSDGVTAPNLATAIPAGFDQLQGVILNVNVPAMNNITTLNSLISWAAGRGDTMLIIDGPAPTPPETSAQVVNNYVNMVTGGSPLTASSYATLYAPWIQIADPASALPGSSIWVPPGGAVLGVWSATDIAKGPWQTPAGISFGAIKLQNIEAVFTPTDLDNLNINNINAIRFVPGFFPAIMGGRTLQQSYPSRYISVRRMLIQLEHDFSTLLQFALFENNNSNLWLQVTNVLENYLTNLMQQGILGGTTQDQAFSVICDSSNNSPSSAGAGIVNASVAVAITSPAEFIIINISQFQNTGVTTISTQQ
jgi:uncharacterized protein